MMTPEKFTKAIKDFEDTISKKSKLIKIRVVDHQYEMVEQPKNTSHPPSSEVSVDLSNMRRKVSFSLSFNVYLHLEDEFVDSEMYKRGFGQAFPNKKFCKLVDETAKRLFGCPVEWYKTYQKGEIKKIGTYV